VLLVSKACCRRPCFPLSRRSHGEAPSDAALAHVDLWVQAPGDVPVGYSNKSGGVLNLLRDDLGKEGHD